MREADELTAPSRRGKIVGMAPVLEPVRLVDRLIARDQAQGFPPDRWTVDTEAPLATPSRPLGQQTASDESSNPRAKERT